MLASPTSQDTPKSSRWKNCLCSPTTHAGSFRCRRHRTSSIGLGLNRVGGIRQLQPLGAHEKYSLVAFNTQSLLSNLWKNVELSECMWHACMYVASSA
ncbi:hypothetical protein D8674_023372 [Pyrus ussuriensis x Pyrus communis]|uniref:Uncharacterized protein n=1 Tax=Pyrus ussuriensis x Pyrus communis TaxID=2448454 RepID=A0A5N5H147_9ROSA|nr:hypothetical protein D8674_023372 [Pyrus ussuriensis x Pyrus communis]